MARQRKVDVVTIGGGWTASILAWKLGEAGLRTVSLEQGPERWANPTFEHNHDSLRFSVRKAMMVDISRETWTWRPDPTLPALPIREFGSFHPGMGLGGSAIHWSGQLWRFTPNHFKYRSRWEDHYGKDKIPENCTLQDFPVSYDEIEPYYDAFEYDIGTSGVAGNLRGEIQPHGNPFEGPRSRPYPLPPLVDTMWGAKFRDASASLGYHPFPQPSGILSEGYTDATGRARSGCLYCGFCTRFGCEVDAKGSPITTHVPLALATGKWTVRTGCYVLDIAVDRSGRATGVRYLDPNGDEQFQPADIVVCSAYTLTNVRSLLLSKSDAHPKGIGNDRGQVGRNATHQLDMVLAEGLFADKLRSYSANTSTMEIVCDFLEDNFDHSDLDFIGGSMIYSSPGEREPVTDAGSFPMVSKGSGHLPVVKSSSGSDAGKPPNWGQAWKDSLRGWDHYAAVMIQGDSLPYEHNTFDLDPVYEDKFGRPLLRFTFDWTDNERAHVKFMSERCAAIMRGMGPTKMSSADELQPYSVVNYQTTHINGGAIMGTDPGSSVTNSYGQVWDTPNVYVTGAALYPFNPGLNPTNTLAALAYRTAERMAGSDDPTELME